MSKISLPLKWHGGKQYLASRIVSLIPQHTHYVEPYFGGGAVLFNKPESFVRGHSEVVNDRNGDLMNFWRVLRNKQTFEELRQQLSLTPFSSEEFAAAKQGLTATKSETKPKPIKSEDVARAAAFFVMYRQSRQGLGKDFATMSRTRTRRDMNEQVSSWLSAIEGLQEACNRLQRVVLFCYDALKVIQREDDPKTFFYLDPPYMHGTRTSDSDYTHEMTDADHSALLYQLGKVSGKFILSGYPSELYAEAAGRYGWHCDEIKIDSKASSQKVKPVKTECLWRNF
jgi:DNA adenine methylase